VDLTSLFSWDGPLATIFCWVVALPLVYGIIAYVVFKTVGISGFRRLFTYMKLDSPVHNLNPITKLLFVLMVAILVAMMGDFWILLGLLLVTIPFWVASKPPEGRIRLLMILMLIQWIAIAWGQSYLNPGFSRNPNLHRILVWPRPLWFFTEAITVEGFLYGLEQGLRVVAALSAAMLFIFTTHPSDIIYALKTFRLPMEVNFMIAVTFRSIPLLLEKSFLVLSAERARGLKLSPEGGSIVKFLRDLVRVIKTLALAMFPIVVEGVRSSRQLAVAASLRAFRAYEKRTYYQEIPLRRFDVFLSLVFLAILVLGFVGATFFGLGAEV